MGWGLGLGQVGLSGRLLVDLGLGQELAGGLEAGRG